MPYIKQKLRGLLSEIADDAAFCSGHQAGNLNFIITKMMLRWVEIRGEKYDTYNEIIGVLECCKQEFYRRQVSKLEDQKCESNGEVFEK